MNANIFEVFQDESPAGTEFRRIHVRLLREATGRPLKKIQITSSRRGEGKSTVSAHLAFSP
jgi:Mrp family chromosome partitioning ATPase